MRVLHCIPSVEGGGAERQLTYLAKALPAEGCDVHVALTRGGANLRRLEEAGATIHQLGPIGTHDPRLFARLVRTFTAVAPSIVHCWLLQMELLGGVAATTAGIPWVLAERSSAPAYPRTVKNALRVHVARFASAIVSNSTAGDQYWEERARASMRRYIVPNALPLEEIRATPAATSEDAGLTSGEACVLYAGRLDAGKNAGSLIRALSLVRSARPFRALLCGDGPLRPQIEHLIDAYGLEHRVRLVGYAANLWSLMKKVDMVVAPSRFEGSPNVVLEAMACGCPLVVSDIPAHREILDDQSAVFFDANDAGALADRIAAVLDDPESAARRARTALGRADRYALPVIAHQYAAVYQDVLSRHGRHAIRVAS
jgi:glycosyltransferase involved in cell wall biosynthesis